MGSQGSKVSSGGKQRLIIISDAQTDFNLRCMHMPTCTLCWIPARVKFMMGEQNDCNVTVFISNSSTAKCMGESSQFP